MDPTGNITTDAILLDGAVRLYRWLVSWWKEVPGQFATVEITLNAEPVELWSNRDGQASMSTTRVPVQGIVTGTVIWRGPHLTDFLQDIDVAAQWAIVPELYPRELDNKRARGVNERFMNLLSTSINALLRHAGPIQQKQDADDAPALFLGLPFMAGLMPANATRGDKIVQFWGSNPALVVRNNTYGNLEIVGKTMVVTDDDFGWDRPQDSEPFTDGSQEAIDLELSFEELLYLALDGVQIDGG
jgi:hypothetical protein